MSAAITRNPRKLSLKFIDASISPATDFAPVNLPAARKQPNYVNFVTHSLVSFDPQEFEVQYACIARGHIELHTNNVSTMTTLFQHKPDTSCLRGAISSRVTYLLEYKVV
jgi:hypothetical protein